MKTKRSKFLDVKLDLFGRVTSDPMENTLSTAAELGMRVLYFRKMFKKAYFWYWGKAFSS